MRALILPLGVPALCLVAAPAYAAWTAGLTISNVASGSAISGAGSSSSSLSATWASAPLHGAVGPSHYRVRYVDGVTGQEMVKSVPGAAHGAQLTGLKAATSYAIYLRACYTADCSSAETPTDGGPGSGTTAQETWQIASSGTTQSMTCYYIDPGSGLEASHSCSVTKVISDANTKAAGFITSGGTAYLYYDALGSPTVSGVSIGSAPSGSYHTVTSASGGGTYYGLANPSAATGYVRTINTSAPVPLTTGNLRLFFEAEDGSGYTRILRLDSSGGYLDFNSDATATLCTDYSSSGTCAPTLVIGNEGDSSSAYYGIRHARQLRVGWPQQSGAYDTANPAFMIFTVDLSDGSGGTSNCLSTYGLTGTTKTQGYAQYAGGSWSVQFDATTYGGCPKIFQDMQAPSLVHRGQGRYKLYYGTPGSTASSCTVPWLGEKRMLFADAGATAPTSTVEYEDWEAKSAQREIQFAWPDGTLLSTTGEGYIDDFEFLAVPGSLVSQHAYLTIASCSDTPFITYATLVNP